MGTEIAESFGKQADFLWSIDTVPIFQAVSLGGQGGAEALLFFPLSFNISCV